MDNKQQPQGTYAQAVEVPQQQQPQYVQQPQYAPPQGQQPQYVQQQPVQYVQQQPKVVMQMGTQVVGGQMVTPSGHCAHAVQSNDFTVCGIVLAILFFPIGILCCMVMTERKCTHCGTVLG